MPEPAPTKMTISALNALEADEFTRVLGNIVELSPSVAYALARLRPFKSTQQLLQELNAILDCLPDTYKQNFLRRSGELGKMKSADMTKDQGAASRAAGLDTLPKEHRAELEELSKEYRKKFGYSFVVCERETKAADWPEVLRRRLANSPSDELVSGMKEIKKIAKCRVLDLVI